jgi:DNA polymerase/3'-5' exonuclease PolX
VSTATAKRDCVKAASEACCFKDLFSPNTYLRWEFAGSVRRKAGQVSDVEHVVIAATGDIPSPDLFSTPRRGNLLWHRLDELIALKDLGEPIPGGSKLTKHLYPNLQTRWGERYRGVDYHRWNHVFLHEVFIADANNLGPILAIRTGPALFSKMLVTKLRDRGLVQEGGYVKRGEGGEIVPCATEEEYFRLCGVEWVEPEHRRDEV